MAGRLNSGVRHMRWSSPLFLVLFAGCAHAPLNPAVVTVIAEPTAVDCSAEKNEVRILLTVRNGSNGKLRLGAKSEAGPPFHLNWVYYRVLSGSASSMTHDLAHGPGGHSRLPTAHVTIGAGDSAQFFASLYSVGPQDQATSFQIELQDLADNYFSSQPFQVCASRSMPNNSFKPSPHQGGA